MSGACACGIAQWASQQYQQEQQQQNNVGLLTWVQVNVSACYTGACTATSRRSFAMVAELTSQTCCMVWAPSLICLQAQYEAAQYCSMQTTPTAHACTGGTHQWKFIHTRHAWAHCSNEQTFPVCRYASISTGRLGPHAAIHTPNQTF